MAFNLNLNATPNNSYESPDIQQFYKKEVSIEQLLIWCSTNDVSDLYIKVGDRPYISRFGKISQIPCVEISKDQWATFYDKNVLNELNAEYVRQKLLDISIEVRIPETSKYYFSTPNNMFRYRASFGFSGEKNICTFRMIRPKKPTFDTINYPKQCEIVLEEAYKHPTGIIFETGATGSGKALHENTLIPIYGYTNLCKRLGKLKLGEFILDENGNKTKIKKIIQSTDKRFFRLHIKDSNNNIQKISCGAGHLWKVYNQDKQESIIEALTIFDMMKIGKKYSILKNINNKKEFLFIDKIEEIEGNNKEYYCLEVDSDTHTFLCSESYIPTHNSTTLAACINTFTQPNNILDNKVIITLEDPVENDFESTKSCKITQKELQKDFKSFALGIKQALREHPDVVIVGECRDKEVISTAIEAARTGHLVSTSFHASDVGGTVSRLLFHLDNDKNLSFDLIVNLNIIMSQRLLKRDDRYLVDTQYLLFTPEIQERIIEITNQDLNIAIEVDKLVHNKKLQELGIAKDWDYNEDGTEKTKIENVVTNEFKEVIKQKD